MKKYFLFYGLILFFLNQSACFGARGNFDQFFQGQNVDAMIVSFMKQNNIPGMALAIVEAPYITKVIGYGLADIQNKRLIATNSIFNIGQITDAYTAVAIMQLVEADMLELDSPIKNYINNLPSNWQNITIRELITHSAGIPSYTKAATFDYSQSYTPEQIFAFIKNKPLIFTPGTSVANSATDYYLLGMLIEKTSRMSYEDFIIKNQFERIPLKNTFFVGKLKTIKNELNNASVPFKHTLFKKEAEYINPIEPATGYTQIKNKLASVKAVSGSATFANADIYSSVEDVSLWDIGLAGQIFIKNPANREFLYQGITLKNGKKVFANANWQFSGFPQLMYIEGRVPGFSSFLIRFTGSKELLCITLFANKENVYGLEELARRIAGAYDPRLGPPIQDSWIESKESPFSEKDTFERFITALKEQNIQIDTSQLKSNGSYELALKYLKDSLVLKINIFKDKAGHTWLTFPNPVALAKKQNIRGEEQNLQELYLTLLKAARNSTAAY